MEPTLAHARKTCHARVVSGGLKGGKASAQHLTPEQCQDIARLAAEILPMLGLLLPEYDLRSGAS